MRTLAHYLGATINLGRRVAGNHNRSDFFVPGLQDNGHHFDLAAQQQTCLSQSTPEVSAGFCPDWLMCQVTPNLVWKWARFSHKTDTTSNKRASQHLSSHRNIEPQEIDSMLSFVALGYRGLSFE